MPKPYKYVAWGSGGWVNGGFRNTKKEAIEEAKTYPQQSFVTEHEAEAVMELTYYMPTDQRREVWNSSESEKKKEKKSRIIVQEL